MSKTDTTLDGLTTEEFESANADLIRTANRSNVETTRSLDVTSGPESASGDANAEFTDSESESGGPAEWMVEITCIDCR